MSTGSGDAAGPLDPRGDLHRSERHPPDPRSAAAAPTLLDAAAVLALAYVVGGAASISARAAFDGALADAAALTVFGIVLGLIVVGWSTLRSGVAGLRTVLGPRPTAAQLAAGAAVGVLAGIVVNIALPPLAEAVLERLGLELPTVQETARRALTEPASRVVAAVGVVVVAPLAEELAFRGVAFRALRRHMRVTVAVVASALLFAALHTVGVSPLGAAYLVTTLSLVGAALAVLVERHRHLWGAVLAHAGFNAVAVSVLWTA